MNNKIIHLVKLTVSVVIAIGATVILYNLWLPVAEWYLNQIPTRGIDLFNSVSYTSYLLNHFSLPMNGWKYTWFAGNPFGSDYTSLYFYLMMPFAKSFGLVQGVQIFALSSFFACIAFSYLLFSALSKNRILAAILAIGVAYSVNMYKALVYAGGIPVFATQAFFPLVLYIIVKFIQTQNRRYLLFAGLVSGLGFMGHPQQFINFIFPSVVFLLLFSHYERRYVTLKKIIHSVIYLLISLLVGLPEFYRSVYSNLFTPLSTFFSDKKSIVSQTAEAIKPEIAEWAKNQFYVSFSDTNTMLIQIAIFSPAFILMGILISKHRIKDLFNTVAILLVAGWAILYVYLLSIGINIYHGGWEAWYKLFWPIPIVLGLLVSQFFGVFIHAIPLWLHHKHIRLFTIIGLEIGFGIVFLLVWSYYFPTFTKDFTDRLYSVGAFSSTFPEAISGRLSDKELAKFKAEARPKMIDDSEKNYRLYSADQTLNLWWNSLFDIPLARGYIDPPLGTLGKRWGLFWMDSAFGKGTKGGTSLGDDWKTPHAVVENNIKFLLDWNAIKYIEGNHFAHQNYGALAPVLTSEKFIAKDEETSVRGGIARDGVNPEKGTWDENRFQQLHFYEVKEELVTPIHYATNAPAVLVIGGGDSFDIILRDIAMMGLTSQNFVVADGPTFIDDVSSQTMNDFDVLVLYKYDYKNNSKVWGRVAKYIEDGGKVFIDTGADVKESSTVDLPNKFPKVLSDIFPTRQTRRGDLGKSWDSAGSTEIFNNVSISLFSNLTFDGKPWNISYPPHKTDDLSDDATVLLTLQGYPVLAKKEYGKGMLIWSGFNLPYHALYNFNMEEAKLFVQILNTLYAPLALGEAQSDVKWISPTKRAISATMAKGVLVKEENYPGWSASVKSDKGSSKLTIYKVGPTEPGFMYVRIPQRFQGGNFTATFSYNGSINTWLPAIVSILTIVIVADLILFGNNFSARFISIIHRKVHKKVGSWWEKEEE